MYDSILPTAIPSSAPAVAGYVDGRLSVWPEEAWDTFATPLKLHISTWGPRNLGDTLDIENGDSIPEDAPPWAAMAIDRGVKHPKLYMSLSDFPRVRALTDDLDVRYFVAHYTNTPHIPLGAHACQWASNPLVTGGNFDLSLCTRALFD